MIKTETSPMSLQERITALVDENRKLRQKIEVMRPVYMKLMEHQGLPYSS